MKDEIILDSASGGAPDSAPNSAPDGQNPNSRNRRHRIIALVAELVAICGVPAILIVCIVFDIDQTALLSLIVVLGCLIIFFAGFEQSRPRLRDSMPIAVMAALGAAGRILFALFPSFKPVSAIAIIAGAVFGRRSGFLVGTLAALVSNFFFGQGPWSPWQMYGWGLVGYFGGVLAQFGLLNNKFILLGYGFVSGLLYGLILNLWSFIGFYHPETIGQVLIIYAAALPFDILHGIATVIFLAALYAPWKRKLSRVKRKFGLAI